MNAAKRRRHMNRKIVHGLRAGKSANTLSKELRVCKKTIQRVRKKAEESGYLNPENPLPKYPLRLFPELDDKRTRKKAPTDELLLPFVDYIQEKLSLGWYPVTIFEELPVTVPSASFYRFLKRHKLTDCGKNLRVVPEILSAPGECLQIDWGKLRTVNINGKKRTVWMLTGVLGFSRYRMVRLVWSTSLAATLEALRSMFDELGGVPARIVSDNEKCLVHKASRYEAVLNPTMERFAAHYGTILEALPPRQPQMKGKVERQIPYLRRLYQAHDEQWWGLEESQDYFNQKLAAANKKRHGTTRVAPLSAFEETERSALKPLPAESYDIEHYHKGKVRQDGHVRFQNKYYSVCEKFIGESVAILGNSTTVCIYHNGELLEVHQRVTEPHVSKSTKQSHLKPWERTFEEESIYRRRARSIGEWAEELIIAILASNRGFIDTRKVWGILSLDKTYEKKIVEEACRLAFEQERFSYSAVRNFAEGLEAREKALLETAKPPVPGGGKFTHSISKYSQYVQLTLLQGGNDESRDSKSTTAGASHEDGCKGAG